MALTTNAGRKYVKFRLTEFNILFQNFEWTQKSIFIVYYLRSCQIDSTLLEY